MIINDTYSVHPDTDLSNLFLKHLNLPIINNSINPEINTIQDLKQVLSELLVMIDTVDLKSQLNDSEMITKCFDSIYEDIIRLGGHISEKICIEFNGTVRNGRGFVYAGNSDHEYKIGQQLTKEITDELLQYLPTTKNGLYPIIMLSLTDQLASKEEYYYFTPIYQIDSHDISYYMCSQVTNNSFCGNSFAHYIAHRLTNTIKIDKNWFYSGNTPYDSRIPMEELKCAPMGTVIIFNDVTLIKASALGNWVGIKAFDGAVDI